MPNQNIIGKAFEFACLEAINKMILSQGKKLKVVIDKNESYKIAEVSFLSLPVSTKAFLSSSGNRAADRLKDLEPRLIHQDNKLKDDVFIKIQGDCVGARGDVRDVVISRENKGSNELKKWEIGLSCKHNHEAIKHSRVSPSIDIGKEWLGINADEEYFSDINRVFNKLKQLKKSGIQKWSDLNNKDIDIYLPALEAVKAQIERAAKKDREKICKNMLVYFVGKEDFYKVIAEKDNNSVALQAFNINSKLCLKANGIKARYKIHQSETPTKIYEIEYKGNTTLVINMNEGWTISMRIHSASTNIENSLKFDVQLVGVLQWLYRENLPL